MKIGDSVKLTEEARYSVPLCALSDDDYIIKDILDGNVEYNIVLENEKFGKDWVQFFKKDEIIEYEK